MGVRGEIFSARYTTQYGQITYFFNIKENRFGDIFLSVVESVKKSAEELSFRRCQIAVFESDWPAFLGFLNKVSEHLAAQNLNRRCRMISGNEKRAYEVTFNRKARVTRVNICEKKNPEDQSPPHTVSIEGSDFDRFRETLSRTIARFKERNTNFAAL